MSYRAYPMPEDYPDYPSHWQVAEYFDAYAERFGLTERIAFNTEVVKVEPVDGEWEVTVRGAGGERSERYRAVLVANGHHWQPRWPEPPFPGEAEFEGERMHVHHYREPDVLVGKRVLVLGIGNSAVDVAVESSRIADKTFLAMRRGAWVLPKFLGGKPIDEAAPPIASRLPIPVQRFFFNRMLKTAVGEMTDYGLPEPDHKLLEAHPTVSSELLPRIGHGDITVKPNIDRFPPPPAVPFPRIERKRNSGRGRGAGWCGSWTGARRRSTWSSTARATGSSSPSSTRRSSRRATTACRSTSGSSRSRARACTSSASSSRWGRSCRWPRRRPNGSPTC